MSKYKKNEDILSIMTNLQPNCCLKVDFQKVDQHAGGKWLIHKPNAARTISCKAWNSPAEYPSWVARCDIKGSGGTVLNPIFWKKVQGQKHPGRWEIAECQIPNNKMLFKTNTKGHKHPSIRLFIIEQDTISKPKKIISRNQSCNAEIGIFQDRSIPQLLMLRLLVSPGHQQPRYWLYRINVSWSSMREDFKYLPYLSIMQW